MKSELILHLGSNLGNRLNYLNAALKMIESELGRIDKTSSIYETRAWGNTSQPDFLNVAIALKCNREPDWILTTLKAIESKIGRQKREHWFEREIDIDIIFYGSLILKEEKLIIPHQMMHLRKFVLVPVNEIYPDYVHPVLNQNVSELLHHCQDNLEVKLWKPSSI